MVCLPISVEEPGSREFPIRKSVIARPLSFLARRVLPQDHLPLVAVEGVTRKEDWREPWQVRLRRGKAKSVIPVS